MRIRGNKFLVRKCLTPHYTDGDVTIYLPLKSRLESNWCEIIERGESCGTKRFNRTWVNNPVDVGMFIVLPEQGMMWRQSDTDLLIDEETIMCYEDQGEIKPFGDRVLLKLEDSESMKDGIILPDIGVDRPNKAEVVALGTGMLNPDGELIPFDMSIGDRVLVQKSGGTDIEHNGEAFRLVHERDVLGVLYADNEGQTA